MFTKVQLLKMFKMQADMNAKVNPDWVTAGNDWSLASMMEACEGIDHHGWKWWKAQTPNLPQLQMELVDMWHFQLSHVAEGILNNYNNFDDVIDRIYAAILDELSLPPIIEFDYKTIEFKNNTLIQNLKLLIGLNSSDRSPLALFLFIMEQAGMSTDELYRQYIGKNVLNFFRQDHGYKEGTYIKIWKDNREDNEHLIEILNGLHVSDPGIDTVLYSKLEEVYKTL